MKKLIHGKNTLVSSQSYNVVKYISYVPHIQLEGIKPHLNTKNLSKVLHKVGINRAGQDIIFNYLVDQSKQLVYDLSSFFSRSMNISQAERGYNKDKIQVPQINLALLCSADSGLPMMIRSLPGSVKDIKTLYHSINELELDGKILVLDPLKSGC